jgi:hypothetical protein
MAIGRTDERQNPLIPVAIIGRPVVWMSLADPIWASGQASRVKGRTHDRIRTNASILKTYLNPTGRPHMVLQSNQSEDGCGKSARPV